MRTGDRQAVQEIFRLLVSDMHGDDLSDGQLKKQLENEYGRGDVDSPARYVSPPSKQELDRVSKTLAAISPQYDAQIDDNIRFPKPDPGFKRSRALLDQIAHLRKPPHPDYTV